MNPEDAVLFPAQGDERCACCHRDIKDQYAHLDEDGFNVIVCHGCFAAAMLTWVAS